ncbi:MAG: DoxX family protein [Bacteroidetes bacterium]|nr:MAG: DoxX family protein [Bacteroidota bacterium]
MSNFQQARNLWTITCRLVVGLIFLSEGIQKYIFPNDLGAGRFVKIGIGHASFWAYFTGAFEIICGTMILFGIYVRIAAIPLFIIMIVAFFTTKLPLLMKQGFWAFAHEYRLDFALTLLLIYLIISRRDATPNVPLGTSRERL